MRPEHSAPRRQKAKVQRQRIHPQPVPIEVDAYYNAHQLAARFGVHIMTIWQWSREGKIPRPVKLGPNVSRWLGSAILAHEAACREEADA